MQETKNNKEVLSWAIFLGSMFIGMGVGEIFGQAGIGMLIGMGVGYIAEAIIGGAGRGGAQGNTAG